MRFVHNRHLLLVYVALGLLLPLLASQPASAQQGGDSYSHSTPSGNRILCVPPQTLSDAGRARWYQENVLTGRIQCPSRAAAAVPKQGSGIDTQGPDNEGPFVKGFLDGVSQCIWSGCTDPKQIAMIGVAFYAARFGQAARLAGVLNAVGRGASVASLVSLINSGEQITSDDPYAMGFAEGKKFCSWESSWLGISMPSFRGGEAPAGGASRRARAGGGGGFVWG